MLQIFRRSIVSPKINFIHNFFRTIKEQTECSLTSAFLVAEDVKEFIAQQEHVEQ
jgi:hypothetical protein